MSFTWSEDADERDGVLYVRGRSGKGGMPAFVAIPAGDIRNEWEGYWPEADPTTKDGLLEYVREQITHARACDRSRRQYDKAMNMPGLSEHDRNRIEREWPYDSALEIAQETLGNIRLILEQWSEADRPEWLAKPHSRDDGIEKLSAAIAWLHGYSGPAATTTDEAPFPAQAIELLVGDEGRQIASIIRSNKSTDEKMREICGIDRRFLAFDSPQWAELLSVSQGAIRKSEFWKEDRPKARDAES